MFLPALREHSPVQIKGLMITVWGISIHRQSQHIRQLHHIGDAGLDRLKKACPEDRMLIFSGFRRLRIKTAHAQVAIAD